MIKLSDYQISKNNEFCLSLGMVKSGKAFKGNCPYHNEKTPSFFINTSRGFFHCFGCGKSGTMEDLKKHLSETEFNYVSRK